MKFPYWLIAVASRAVAISARLMPLETPSGCVAGTLLFAFGLGWMLPHLLASAIALPGIAGLLLGRPGSLQAIGVLRWAIVVAGVVGVGLFQARCLQLCYPERFGFGGSTPEVPSQHRPAETAVTVAGMPIAEEDLRTSILVTGVTGSSKTAGILLPLLGQLFARYDGQSREAIGAFIPEVKGDLVDAAIYLAHRAGRCVSREVIVLSPCSRIPVVRYRDERGRRWFLSARGGAGGADAGDYFPDLVYPQSHPCAGRRVPLQALEDPAACAAILPAWSRCRIPLAGTEPRFIGWRWRAGRLWRVSHTDRIDAPVPLRRFPHDELPLDPPETLIAEAVEFIDNGVHYNLIDPALPAAEVAERLTRLAAMARASGARGENDYFYDQGRKLLAACLSLHRAISPEPATVVDLIRLATQDARLESALERLEALPEESASKASDLLAYFRGEWLKMVADGKTANVIKSTLSASFDLFVQDANLAETFCRRSTFSFEQIASQGKIIGFVPGERYEQVGRVLGTACKLDFQSSMLVRTGRADLNRTRLALYLADECHKYALGGSASAGDPFFMNLSRSNQVVNVCATQSYAWLIEVLGREAANVYISAFGVQYWLQQTDPETCRRAAEICGLVTRERVSAEHDLNLGGMVSALESGRELTIRRRRQEEETSRHRSEDFALLDVGAVIAYNKGRPGRSAKVHQDRVTYLECTRPPEGPLAIRDRVREYYRELLENRSHDSGRDEQWDAVPLDAALDFASYEAEAGLFS